MPLTDTPNGLKAITTTQALVDRLEERACRPQPFSYHGLTGWRARCPLNDPLTPGSCGYLTVREGDGGEALVAGLCPHSLPEMICELLGVFPDDPQVWHDARRRTAR